MIREWAEDIRTKTKDMGRGQKAEYVLHYYWYHILLSVLSLGILTLGIYHVTWGRKTVDFSLVFVNQDINYERDSEICKEFAAASGIREKGIQIDSDYLLSYDAVRLDGVNESSYEKFFFNWSYGRIDAMVIPKSFYAYCKRQGGEYTDPIDLLPAAAKLPAASLFWDGETCAGIYADGLYIQNKLKQDKRDPYILVFPAQIRHTNSAVKFLEYCLQPYKTKGLGHTISEDRKGEQNGRQ